MNFVKKALSVVLMLAIIGQSQAMMKRAGRAVTPLSAVTRPMALGSMMPRLCSFNSIRSKLAARGFAAICSMPNRSMPSVVRSFGRHTPFLLTPRVAQVAKKPFAKIGMGLFAGLTATLSTAGFAKAEAIEQSDMAEIAESNRIYKVLVQFVSSDRLKGAEISEDNIAEWHTIETFPAIDVITTRDGRRIELSRILSDKEREKFFPSRPEILKQLEAERLAESKRLYNLIMQSISPDDLKEAGINEDNIAYCCQTHRSGFKGERERGIIYLDKVCKIYVITTLEGKRIEIKFGEIWW